ncbi:MFS transporter [Pseudonocardiaceae bacterium YIM PH 21723]|nr:MFS transporter [Pseudonocardiaceae bacterium YIM PH 21723]
MHTITERETLPWNALLALTTTAFLTVLTENIPAGLLPAMAAGLGVSLAVAGQSVTIFALGTVATAIPIMVTTSAWNRKRLLSLVIVGFIVANAITALSGLYWLTLLARLLGGVAAGLVWSLQAGFARRLSPPQLRGRAIAVAMAGIPLALALGIPAGTLLGNALGWQATFWTISALGVALLIWITLAVPDHPGSPASDRPTVRRTLAVPGITASLLITSLFVLAHFGLYTYVAPVLRWRGMGEQVDLALLVYGIAGVAGLLITGTLIDGRVRVLTAGGVALILVAGLALVGPVPTLVTMVVWGLGFGGLPALSQAAIAHAEGDTAQAVLVTLWNLATAVGGLVGGLLLSGFGAGAVPWLVPVLLVPALWLLWRRG